MELCVHSWKVACQTVGTVAYQTVGTVAYQTVGTVAFQTVGTVACADQKGGVLVLPRRQSCMLPRAYFGPTGLPSSAGVAEAI